MPVIKLSKVTIPPPKPKGTPVSLPGAPAPFPADPNLPDPTLPDAGVDLPVVADEPVAGVTDQVGETFAANARQVAPEEESTTASVPTELIEKLWHAVEIVPGLTLDTALTLALQQFLATLPDDYEREAG